MSENVEFDLLAREVFAPIYPVIARTIKNKTGIDHGRCLDVGCAGGYLGIALAKITNLHVYLLDKSPKMLNIAERNVKGSSIKGRVTITEGDVHRLPFQDKFFNIVISRGSVFFWKNLIKAFKEIHRVLAPNGIAYIGGGFGTVDLLEEIKGKMDVIDPTWKEKVGMNLGANTIVTFQEALHYAGINTFTLSQEGAGLWVIIHKANDL